MKIIIETTAALDEHPAFVCLCDNDKETLRSFIRRSCDTETRELILSKTIELIKREPNLAKVDVSSDVVLDHPFLPHCHSRLDKRLRPMHVVLLSYGRPRTETEAELSLQLLELTYTRMKNVCKRVEVDLGVEWVPHEGWGPLEIALLCRCDSRLIEWLSLKEKNRRKSVAVLAAVLGRRVEFAKSLAKPCIHAAVTQKISLRERLHVRSHRRSVLDLLLTMPQDDSRQLDLLKFFLDARPHPICFERDAQFSGTPGKTDVLLKCLRDRKQEAVKMKYISWSFNGFHRLLSGLESNNFLCTMNLRIPDHLVRAAFVHAGLTRMFQQMNSLTYLEIDLEEDSWLNNQLIFDALAESFPVCNVRSVAFNGCMRFTNEHRGKSGLYGGHKLEKVLSNIQQVRFGIEMSSVDFVGVMGRAASLSRTLEHMILVIHDEVHPPDAKLGMPLISHLPRCCGLNLDVVNYDLHTTVLDDFAASFEKYGVLINELSLATATRSPKPWQLLGTANLSVRSNAVKLHTWNCCYRPSIVTAIASTSNLVELSLRTTNPSCRRIPLAVREEVFDTVTELIVNGRLTKLTLPLTFVREKSHQCAALWTKLTKLEFVGCGFRGHCLRCRHELIWSSPASAQAPSTLPIVRLGEDLIKLVERSTSLSKLVMELDLKEEHASVLRHRIMCNYSRARLVQDASSASIATVCSVLSRLNDSFALKVYRFTPNDDKENEQKMGQNYETARVSAAFEVLLQSSGIVAGWCNANRWRWKEKEDRLNWTLPQ